LRSSEFLVQVAYWHTINWSWLWCIFFLFVWISGRSSNRELN